jgi:hypothetical protein
MVVMYPCFCKRLRPLKTLAGTVPLAAIVPSTSKIARREIDFISLVVWQDNGTGHDPAASLKIHCTQQHHGILTFRTQDMW